MGEDKYAKELERAVFNWYYGGDDAAPQSVFNAVANGLKNEMQVIVPIEFPEAMLQSIGNPEQVKVGDVFSVSEDIPIRFRHLAADEEGQSMRQIQVCFAEMKLTELSMRRQARSYSKYSAANRHISRILLFLKISISDIIFVTLAAHYMNRSCFCL